MSRTHILAGEGNVGYVDLNGSPLISAVMDTTKYSAVGTGTSLYLFTSHCINKNITVNCSLAHDFTLQCGGITSSWLRAPNAGIAPHLPVLHLSGLQEDCKRSRVTVYLIHITLKRIHQHLSAIVLKDTDLRTALMETIWTGKGETDPNTALEGTFTWKVQSCMQMRKVIWWTLMRVDSIQREACVASGI